jgi:hypothetical protein
MRQLGEIGGKELALVDAAMADIGVEITIGAFGEAERPMHINPERLLPLTQGSPLVCATLSHEGRGKFVALPRTPSPLPSWESEGPTAAGGGRVRG